MSIGGLPLGGGLSDLCPWEPDGSRGLFYFWQRRGAARIAVERFLVGPLCGLSWRIPCSCRAWVPLSVRRCGRAVNSERDCSPGQTAGVLLKQHAFCIPPRYFARGKNPDSPAKPNLGRTRKQATWFKAQTALAEESEKEQNDGCLGNAEEQGKRPCLFKESVSAW